MIEIWLLYRIKWWNHGGHKTKTMSTSINILHWLEFNRLGEKKIKNLSKIKFEKNFNH